jgi:hypothetical protein
MRIVIERQEQEAFEALASKPLYSSSSSEDDALHFAEHGLVLRPGDRPLLPLSTRCLIVPTFFRS